MCLRVFVKEANERFCRVLSARVALAGLYSWAATCCDCTTSVCFDESSRRHGPSCRASPLPGETGLSPEASFHPLNNEGNHGLCASRCVPTRVCLCLRVRAPAVVRVSFLSGVYLRGCPVVSGEKEDEPRTNYGWHGWISQRRFDVGLCASFRQKVYIYRNAERKKKKCPPRERME